MASLREKLEQLGFESNDDYDLPLRCLLESPLGHLRVLNIVGDSERRKTAFATALAHAIEFPHVLYHDFTDRHPPQPDVILPPASDELGRQAPPIEPLDEVVTEACAHSEGEPTVLILDQLQAADFREHLRIHRLARDGIWTPRDGRYFANPRNLLLFLISEEPLYHALQKLSFRVWIGRTSERQMRFSPADFGLGDEAAALFEALARLFQQLGTAPTRSEYAHLLRDLQLHVSTAEHLRLCLYGRAEGVERAALQEPPVEAQLHQVLEAASALGVTEHIELAGPPTR